MWCQKTRDVIHHRFPSLLFVYHKHRHVILTKFLGTSSNAQVSSCIPNNVISWCIIFYVLLGAQCRVRNMVVEQLLTVTSNCQCRMGIFATASLMFTDGLGELAS